MLGRAGGEERRHVWAWQITAYGAEPRDVLVLNEVPEPVPTVGEILVRVEAVALNFPDVLLCQGGYQEGADLPFAPGMEAAGRVVAAGPGVAIRVGSRVAGVCHPPRGGLAELTVQRATETCEIPDDLSFGTATAMGVTYQTGYIGLHRRAKLRAGETLLVHAGAGGVGSAAIQLGKAAGARVLAAAGGAAKAEICRELGADEAIDYRATDFVAWVKEITGGRGADVIYDPVGGEVFDLSRKVVAFEGRIVVVGFTSGRIAEAPTNHLLIKNYSVIGLHTASYWSREPGTFAETYQALLRLRDNGCVDPLISARVGLDEVPDALSDLGSRRTVGRVIVVPDRA